MPYSEAQKRATMKHKAKAYEQFQLQLKKGKKAEYKEQAAVRGLSLTAYIVSLLEADRANLPDGIAVREDTPEKG